MDPTPDETLTLITCVPDGIYDHRLVVQAKRVDPDIPPPLALERPG
jgi:LPXTG-site transpeptidase (sortase) family protein